MKDFWIPLLSTIVALAGILSGVLVHVWSSKTQIAVKQYEVTFIEKQRRYASFVRYLTDSYYTAVNKNGTAMNASLDRLESVYFGMEPFLDDDTREALWVQIHQFALFCRRVFDQKMASEEEIVQTVGSFTDYRHNFRKQLYSGLFETTEPKK